MSPAIEGCWRLVEWVQRYDDGRVVEPFGPSPQGLITYVDGRMSCVISRADRSPFSAGQWISPDEDKAKAYDEVLAYCGTYSVDGNVVTHHVEQAIFPAWVGHDQRRTFVLDGATLSLVARLEDGTPEARSAELRWRR